jgi:metal transporter CNNM
MAGEDRKAAEMARSIYPVRKNGNLLLCTLLLGNVIVNALVSIVLADKAGGLLGLVASTFTIVIFGEIIPQAVCTRYALEIGGRCSSLVKVIIFLFFPCAAPLAFVLNMVMGQELPTTYSSGEMRKVLEIHVKEGRFDHETAGAMEGALRYKVSMFCSQGCLILAYLVLIILVHLGCFGEGGHDAVEQHVHVKYR